MALGIAGDLVEHLEELLAAPRLTVQRDEQRLLRPLALRAPRRREHGFVQARAQRVARGADDLRRDARGARPLFESPDLVERMTPESADFRRRQRPAQLTGEQQQRTRGPHEWIESGAEKVEGRVGNRLDARDGRRGRAHAGIGVAASGEPRRPAPGRGRMTVASDGLNGSSKSGIGAILHQPRMAQNSSAETRELTRAGGTPRRQRSGAVAHNS